MFSLGDQGDFERLVPGQQMHGLVQAGPHQGLVVGTQRGAVAVDKTRVPFGQEPPIAASRLALTQTQPL